MDQKFWSLQKDLINDLCEINFVYFFAMKILSARETIFLSFCDESSCSIDHLSALGGCIVTRDNRPRVRKRRIMYIRGVEDQIARAFNNAVPVKTYSETNWGYNVDKLLHREWMKEKEKERERERERDKGWKRARMNRERISGVSIPSLQLSFRLLLVTSDCT